MKKLKETEAKIRGYRCEAHARGFLQYVKEKTAQPQPEAPKEEASAGKLITNMKKFDASFVKNKQLIAFPPEFEPIKCKTLLFDLALGACEFPSLEARKKSKSGFFSFWR
jgi:signal recognition particle subunit SRP68